MYFWEANPRRAVDWALNGGAKRPCAIGAVIELGYCLDLFSAAGIEAVRGAYDSLNVGLPVEPRRAVNRRPLPEDACEVVGPRIARARSHDLTVRSRLYNNLSMGANVGRSVQLDPGGLFIDHMSCGSLRSAVLSPDGLDMVGSAGSINLDDGSKPLPPESLST